MLKLRIKSCVLSDHCSLTSGVSVFLLIDFFTYGQEYWHGNINSLSPSERFCFGLCPAAGKFILSGSVLFVCLCLHYYFCHIFTLFHSLSHDAVLKLNLAHFPFSQLTVHHFLPFGLMAGLVVAAADCVCNSP